MSAIDKDLGMATAYAYAVSKGYTGTEEEFAQHIANVGQTAQAAAESAESAARSATTAGQSAESAAQSALEVSGAVTDAEAAATAAGESEAAAVESAADAETEALKSEGHAVGKQDGVDVDAQSEYYQNNSKYYSDRAKDIYDDAVEVRDSIPADYSQLSQDVDDLKTDLDETDDALRNGFYTLSSDSFRNGNWTMSAPSGQYTETPRAIRTKAGIPVKPGDVLSLKPGVSDLYIRWAVFNESDVIVDEYKGTYDRIKITEIDHTFTEAGMLYINIGNGHNYGNSTNITPSDMIATINLTNFFATKEIAKIHSELTVIESDTDLIYSKVLSESKNTSSDTWYFIPFTFVAGQVYIIKVKFTSFTSTTNRKYTIITTKSKSSASTNVVQQVAIINATAPEIGKWYEYRFTAIAHTSGVNAAYLGFEMSVTAASEGIIEIYSVPAQDLLTKVNAMEWVNGTDIVSLNHDIRSKILNGKKPFGRETTVPFALLHFSDIHANQANLERIVDMRNHLGTDIDDTICTGDIVYNNYSTSGMDFWNAVSGAENILIAIGNHDLSDGQSGYSADHIGQTVAYQTYFAPYLSNWGVTMAGENLTYWYKDYASHKVRLIALNYLLTGDEQTAQNTWLAARLAEAKTSGYAVVIAEHVPISNWHSIDCNFSIIGKAWTYNEYPALYLQTVQDFIDGGGEFACYIAGHAHGDYVGYNSDYLDQVCVVVTCANRTGYDNDQRRENGEKSQDAANVVIVDTITKTVKLIRVGADMDTYLRGRHMMTIRYTDKQILAQS